MAFKPVRKESRPGHNPRVRFEFDGERGIIRHQDRSESHPQDYQIEAKEGRWLLTPLDVPRGRPRLEVERIRRNRDGG